MGTSTSFTGGKNSNPLIPDWLKNDNSTNDNTPSDTPEEKPSTTPVKEKPEEVIPNRFSSARRSFNTFTKSGGSDDRSLKRAVSSYITKTAGGYKRAAQRMRSERNTLQKFGGILAAASTDGIREVVKQLHLDHLVKRPIIEIYAALVDIICEPGGDLDNSYARDAYIETLVQISELGITDLETPSKETILLLFEKFIANSIRERILNAIGNNTVVLPDNIQTVQNILSQLLDFISGAVNDTMADVGETFSVAKIQSSIDNVFERSFQILQQLAEQEDNE